MSDLRVDQPIGVPDEAEPAPMPAGTGDDRPQTPVPDEARAGQRTLADSGLPDIGEPTPLPDIGEPTPLPDPGVPTPLPDPGEPTPIPGPAPETVPVPDPGEPTPLPEPDPDPTAEPVRWAAEDAPTEIAAALGAASSTVDPAASIDGGSPPPVPHRAADGAVLNPSG